MALSDTSDKAREVYFQRIGELTPSERVRWGVEIWKAGDALQRAAIRREHPNVDEAEITFQLAVTRFGLELARKAYRRT